METRPPPRRAAIIVNPVSGQSRSRRRARKLLYRLAYAGVAVVLHETTGPGDARQAAARLAGEVDLLASVGGDGTLNDTLNGVLDAGAKTPVLVVSTGTANVVSRELQLPLKLPSLVEAAMSGRVRALDVGIIRNPDGGASRRFALCVGAGFDAAVVERIQALRTAAGITRWAYGLPILETLLRYSAPPMRVKVDGKVVEEQAVFTVVANTCRYGGDFQLCRDACADDGWLDLCCVNRRGAAALMQLGWNVLCSGKRRIAGVNFYRGRAIELDAAARVPVQVDGDCAGELPLKIEVLPQAVNFCVP